MADKEYLESVISKFECPICLTYMHPPIRQCVSGHSFCSHCFENIENCALCRAEKSSYRCILLEQIHESLPFPCKYVDEGCSFKGNCQSRTIHEKHCEFSSVCPLRLNSCRWRGFRSGILDHCRADHPENIILQNPTEINVPDFVQPADFNEDFIVYIRANLFRFSWSLNRESGVLRFAVYSLGKPLLDKLFEFKIVIFVKNTRKEALSMFGPCYPLINNENTRFIGDKYVLTNNDMIKDLVDDDGVFHFSIRIIDRNLVLPQNFDIESAPFHQCNINHIGIYCRR